MHRKQDIAKASPMQVGDLTQRKNEASKVQTATPSPAPANPVVDDTTKKPKRLEPIDGLGEGIFGRLSEDASPTCKSST